jgi:ABC-type nitrate/sulfonate/bicarbonate transport system substrate-binding protein
LTEGNQAEIAQILCSNVGLLAKAGADYKVIAVRDQKNPIAFVSLPRNKVEKPTDLQGKRWGYSAGFSPEQYLLDNVSKDFGFDSNSIVKINMDFNARLISLLDSTVDFVSAWYGSALPVFQDALTRAGQTPITMKWDDFGIDIYGECFIARSEYVAKNESTLRRWIEVATAGYEYVLQNPEDGLSAVKSRYGAESVKEPIIRQSISQSNELLQSKKNEPMLRYSAQKLARTLKLLGSSSDDDVARFLWRPMTKD